LQEQGIGRLISTNAIKHSSNSVDLTDVLAPSVLQYLARCRAPLE